MAQGKERGKGFPKTHFWWILLSALLLVLVCAFAFHSCRLNIRLKEVKGELEGLWVKLEYIQGVPVLNRGERERLQEQGLADPEADLASDLMQHNELIPYEGVMGGTMGFYSKEDIYVLSPRWVLAAFEDGHIGGRMLLEYTVSPGSDIHWRVLSAYLH